jgi:hypothetical protein
MITTREDLETLIGHGHPVVEEMAWIVAADPAGRLGDKDLEDLTWRYVAAAARQEDKPDDEGLKEERRSREALLGSYMEWRLRTQERT